MNQIKMGKFIKELRQEKGLTQKEIGDQLNITDNSVSKWERGINTPDIYYLAPLSKILGVSINELLNGERHYKKKNKKRIIYPLREFPCLLPLPCTFVRIVIMTGWGEGGRGRRKKLHPTVLTHSRMQTNT